VNELDVDTADDVTHQPVVATADEYDGTVVLSDEPAARFTPITPSGR
jgi:hypothetical protein